VVLREDLEGIHIFSYYPSQLRVYTRRITLLLLKNFHHISNLLLHWASRVSISAHSLWVSGVSFSPTNMALTKAILPERICTSSILYGVTSLLLLVSIATTHLYFIYPTIAKLTIFFPGSNLHSHIRHLQHLLPPAPQVPRPEAASSMGLAVLLVFIRRLRATIHVGAAQPLRPGRTRCPK